MSGVNVGTAYLEIVPSAKGFVGKLQSDLGGGMSKAGDQAGERFGSGMKGRLGGMAKGIVAPLAAVTAAIGVKDFLGGAISEARESQKVGALTTQVIKSTGGAAKVTADQVGNLATAISNKTGIDDEAIQSGANMLLTFKNIKNEAGKGNDIFNQTTSILTDMSSVMGTEPKQAAIQLGKALNDPVKGISALSRVGVTFTEQQKKTIKSLVDGGKTAEAQKIILKELGSEFGGAAAAQATAGEKAATSWANFKEAVGTAILPILDKLLSSLSTVTNWMTANLPGAISTAKDALKPLGSLFSSVFSSIGPVIDSAKQGISDLIDQFTLGDWEHQNSGGVGGFIYNLGVTIHDFITTAGPIVKSFFQDVFLPALRKLGDFVTTTVIPAVSKLAAIFVANVLPVIRQVGNFVATTLIPRMQEIGAIIFGTVVPAVAAFVRGFIANALPAIQKIAQFISGTLVPNVLSLYRTILANVIPIVRELANQFVTNVLPSLQSLWQTITTKVIPVLIRVANVVVPVVAWLGKLVAKILGFVIPILLRLIGPTLGALIRVIGTVIGVIAGFVGALISIGTTIVKFLAPKITWLYNNIFKPYFGFIGSVVKSTWSGVIKPAFDALSSGVGKLGDAFSGAKDLIGRVWSGVVDKITGPIKTVVRWVGDHFVSPINSLLSKVGVGFRIPWPSIASGGTVAVGHGGGHVPRLALATGGVLPGYSPGTDNMHFVGPHGGLSLSGGEAIMRPEWTRAIGRRGVDAMNAAARTGGIGAVRKLLTGHQAFSIGGVIGDIGGGIKNVVGKGIDLAKDAISFITNPGKIVERLLGGIGGSFWGKIAKGALGKAVSGIVSKVTSFGGGAGGAMALGGAGSGKPGSGWQWMWKLISSHFPGVSLTSAFRPGAHTAGSGQLSMHALGRAIDIGGSESQLLKVARWIASNYGSKSADLLYTPAFGNMGIYRGKWYRQPAITTAEHGNHVHWGFNRGGVLPYRPPVFDQGGTLAPGINVVDNQLGKPEALRRADHGGQPIHIEINGVPMDNTQAVAKELLYSMNRNGIGKWASI